ncbi:hypothetical protein SKAU_G00329220 [Synaphobranchus kaupii]|uniref:Uncharacterized protein n=1 Tax=Synaphobranchus kaupii TaxID=118154 RepID=A0A9Q1EQD1_SYNKA|nr:hypothetical protein SKAU_G00329220 [Synaphobranchus kaupii]
MCPGVTSDHMHGPFRYFPILIANTTNEPDTSPCRCKFVLFVINGFQRADNSHQDASFHSTGKFKFTT